MFSIKIVETESGKLIVNTVARGYVLAQLGERGKVLLENGIEDRIAVKALVGEQIIKIFPPAIAALVSDLIKAQLVYSAPSAPPEPEPQIVTAREIPLPQHLRGKRRRPPS